MVEQTRPPLFLVEYRAEQGLLISGWRVLSVVSLRSALIVVADTIRPRWGDNLDDHTTYLQSALSGASWQSNLQPPFLRASFMV